MSEELAKPDGQGMITSIPFAGDLPKVYTSLDPKKPHDVITLMKARQGSTATLKDYVNKPITIKHLLKHKVADVNDETGEIKEWQRWCLIDPDGVIVSTGSAPVEGDILTLISVLGPPPWEDGPVVTPVFRTSKRNPSQQYIQLDLDEKKLVSLLEKKGKRK